MKRFTHFDFALGVPEGWSDASTVALVGPAQDGFAPSITITRQPLDAEISAQKYAENQGRELQQEFSTAGYTVLQQGVTKLNSTPAYERMFTFRVPGQSIVLQQWQTYIIINREALTITCTNRKENFLKAAFQPALDKFASVKVETA